MRKYSAIMLTVMLMFPGAPVFPDGTWCKVYFTSPGGPGRHSPAAGPEAGLVSSINGAKKKFYGAFYEISSRPVIDALLAAKKRNIDVKIVTESDNCHGESMDRLSREGVPIVQDKRPGLMHNKFAVIDDTLLWTGSYNVTENGSRKNNNNAILIYSVEISRIFLAEFNEMFDNRTFGNRSEKGPFAALGKKYYVKINGTNVNAYFSPEDNIERIIMSRLKDAKKSIHFMAFSFTSKNISEIMIKKHRLGVKVYGVMERRGTRSKYSRYAVFKVEGVPVRLDRNRHAMHHKVIIIDGYRVITGSFNFSKNANNKNDENILIIDNEDIAAEYIKEFNRLY